MRAFTQRRAPVALLWAALLGCSDPDVGPRVECARREDCATPAACELVACVDGTCEVSAAALGASCGLGLRCDAAGACVECLAASECPGTDGPCRTRTCAGGSCGLQLVIAGTPLPAQTPGDCREQRCDAASEVTSAVDDLDLPDDGSACTTDACSNGTPSSTPLTPGTPCAAGVCDAGGQCVGCVAASDCPGTDTECRARSCDDGVCGVSLAPQGTATSAQTAGDCHRDVCDAGNVAPEVDDGDVPVDGKTCTGDVCSAGVPSNPFLAAGSSCSEAGGTVCDGAGACVECLSGSGCASGVCAGNVCQPPACDDEVRNGAETDVDCGGSACAPCAAGRACAAPTDCASERCELGTCAVACDPVVNEVQTEGAVWASDEFAEVYNPCPAGVDVSGWRISFFPFGLFNSEYPSFVFPAGTTLASGGYLVVGGAQYPGAKIGTIDSWGSFMSTRGVVGLLNAADTVVDAVAYGAISAEGASTVVPGPGESVGRKPNGADTDENSVDFALYRTPTPGAANP